MQGIEVEHLYVSNKEVFRIVPYANKSVNLILLLLKSQVSLSNALYRIGLSLAIALAPFRLCGTLLAKPNQFPAFVSLLLGCESVVLYFNHSLPALSPMMSEKVCCWNASLKLDLVIDFFPL